MYVMADEPHHREYGYTGIRIEQQPNAPLMYVLGVDAAELLEWADVPNAKADYMAGYQRAYSEERARDIKDFLDGSPNNIIPGSVIVTVASSSISVTDSNDSAMSTLTIQVDDQSFETRLKDIYEGFVARLSEGEKESIRGSSDPAAAEGESDEYEDAGIPDSYLAALTAELRQATEDMSELPPERQSAIRNYVESVSKPALIIDGQHRVFGAKDVAGHQVILPILLLPGLDVGEQVFHFYVLNNKAKPLSPTELRRTISTSLTNEEIDRLWQRFEDAGVNPEATRWTHKANADPSSPFRDLIDFGLGGSGFLKENVMYQLVSRFVNMPRKYRVLYKDITAFQQRDDGRLDYFYAFWSAIRERYQQAWDAGTQAGGTQFFMKASMLVLQEFILDFLVQVMTVRDMEGKPSPLTDFDDLKDLVKASVRYLPDEFFTLEWQEKQLDTSERRAFLRGQMEVAVRNQGKFLGNQLLFRKA